MQVADASVEWFEDIDSTMSEARRRAARGELGPVWLLARRQSAGHGRRGRAWASIDGNFMATLLSPDAGAPADKALIGFAAGVALVEVFETYVGAERVALKWPNDVLIDAAKAAGLMLDASAGWIALGVGANLAAAPEGLDQKAVSLAAAAGAAPSPADFLAAFAPRLAHWRARLGAEGFAPLREAWLARAYGLGARIRVAAGERELEGRFTGLSPRGELELDTATGPARIAAGDILLAEAA